MAVESRTGREEGNVRRYTDPGEYSQETGRYSRKGVILERTKTIKAGDYLECEIFPMVAVEPGNRDQKRKRTPEQMRMINQRNAVKKLVRLMNANFGPGDLMPHLTMDRECSFDEMQRTVRNFFQRLRRLAAKRGAQLKYIYVIETKREHGGLRHHVHGVVNGGWITRDEIEQMWGHGLSRVDRVQQQPGGLKGFARYITQQKETQERLMARRWGASKGLKQPRITTSDSKFSRAQCEKIIQAAETDARALFEKKYPGYRLVEQPVIRYSEFLPGAYIYAFLERRESTRPDGRDAEDGQHGERRASTVRGA